MRVECRKAIANVAVFVEAIKIIRILAASHRCHFIHDPLLEFVLSDHDMLAEVLRCELQVVVIPVAAAHATIIGLSRLNVQQYGFTTHHFCYNKSIPVKIRLTL